MRLASTGGAVAIWVLAVAPVLVPNTARGQDLVLLNANVLDPATQTSTAGAVIIRDGRIEAVGPDLDLPTAVEHLDVGGRFVLPLLIDLHTHSFGNSAMGGVPQMLGPLGTARQALFAGVGAYLDLFSPEAMILGARDAQRASADPGALIYAAGPCLTATDGHCSEYGVPTRIVDTPEDARREIAELAPRGPDVIKLVYDNATYSGRSMPTVDRATMEAVVEAAHEHGFKAILHVGTWQDIADAIEAGADAVTHTPGPEPVPEGLAERMAEAGTLHVPTLAVQSELGRLVEDPALLDRPLLQAMAPEPLIAGYRNHDAWPEAMQRFAAWTSTLREPNQAAVAVLAAAGVPMATGTDGGNPGVFQGFSVHREMELLVEAGLSEWDALAAATTTPAAFLELDWGVQVGQEAHLLILDRSPLEDIANTQEIHGIVQGGRAVNREALLAGASR